MDSLGEGSTEKASRLADRVLVHASTGRCKRDDAPETGDLFRDPKLASVRIEREMRAEVEMMDRPVSGG